MDEARQSHRLAEELEVLAKRLHLDFDKEGDRFPGARREIARILDPWFATRMFVEIRKIFDKHNITWAPYRSVRETIEHDADCSTQNPMFRMVEQPGIGTYLMPGSPLEFGRFSSAWSARRCSANTPTRSCWICSA